MGLLNNLEFIADDDGKKWYIVSSVCKEIGINNNATNLVRNLDSSLVDKMRVNNVGQWQVVINSKGLFLFIMNLTPREGCRKNVDELREELIKKYKIKFND